MAGSIRNARPIQRWVTPSLPARGDGLDFREPWRRSLIWNELALRATVPERGIDLFPGTLAERRRVWNEFSNFVRQAKAYDDGAAKTDGSSRALLLYYSALNLAKAELLKTSPNKILGRPVHHGLSTRLSKSPRVDGDSLKVIDGGVFPLLYEAQIGAPWPKNASIPIRRLLQCIPEVGSNISQVLELSPRVTGLSFVVADDATATWSLMLIENGKGWQPQDRESLTRQVMKQFHRVELMDAWRKVFSYSGRASLDSPVVLEMTAPANGTLDTGGFGPARAAALDSLKGLIDGPVSSHQDAVISLGLYQSRPLPLPPSLARYAAMFYLSSLVRYRPSRLDPRIAGSHAWLLESVVEETRDNLLTNRFEGILGLTVRFGRGFDRV